MRFFSCLFGQTPKEKDQSELIQKQGNYIKKQNEKIELLKNNQSNIDYAKDRKIEKLTESIDVLKEMVKKIGDTEEDVYFSELKKMAIQDYEKSHFKGKGKKISEQETKPLTDEEAKERIKKLKEKHAKNDM